jgi:hypothetical protein
MAYSISTDSFAKQTEHTRDSKGSSDRAPIQVREPRLGPARKGMEITNLEVAEIVELVKRKLAWLGLRSVKIGPFIRVNERAILIDLLAQDSFLCCIKVDRRSGAISRSGNELRPLIASLRTEEGRV